MTTVREAAFDLLRDRGMTTIFGNPGSTELPMLADFPADFRYVLGLHEAVAVGMADGFAQASGTVGHVNLHTAPGLGNAMGAIWTAQANHAPLLVTAGQQVRAHVAIQASLTNRDATRVPHPFVKWSHEPALASDVPLVLASAIHRAALPPKGPVFVSIPMDDWAAEVDDQQVAFAAARAVTGRAVRRPAGPPRAGSPARGGAQPGARRRPGRRHRGRLGRGGRAGREAAVARLVGARHRRRAARLPGGAPALPRDPATGDRPDRPDAGRARPCARGRLGRLPLLPVRARPVAGRGDRARRDHQRPRRGGAGADGRCDRRRRRAHARGAGRRGGDVRAPRRPSRGPARPRSRTPCR